MDLATVDRLGPTQGPEIALGKGHHRVIARATRVRLKQQSHH